MSALIERLSHLNPERVVHVQPQSPDRVVEVTETENLDGYARVAIAVPAGRSAISLRLDGQKVLGLLKSGKSADGHLLVESADGTWTAVVLECKVTLSSGTLAKATQQIRASFIRIQLVADFLQVAVGRRVAVIATREDRVAPHRTADPALLKQAVSVAAPAPHYLDWKRRRLSDVPFAASDVPLHALFLHQDSGEGSLDLTPLV